MLLKCCTQHASKFGKFSNGHRNGKGVFIPIPKKGNAKERSRESHLVVSESLRSHELYSPWNSPGQNTGVVASLFSWGSSQPRDQTQVSCIAGRFFTRWATREAQECSNYHTIAFILQTSKVMLKFSKPAFNSMWTMNFQMFKLDLE